jgi:2-dehydro-3-deoxyphosphogluconate aldolase/(4S)-4-hydroxy-2-oxoglutarate aldolase
LSSLERVRVVGVLRATSAEKAFKLAESALQAGLPALEITLTTPGAADVLVRLRERNPSSLLGLGTVTCEEELRYAVTAGADFAVSPHINESLIEAARSFAIPYIPGAFTPSEVLRALQAGCGLVKLFPATRAGGVPYLKDLLGPFPDLKALVTGGVDVTNARAYLDGGARMVGLGSVFAAGPDETGERTRELLESLTE